MDEVDHDPSKEVCEDEIDETRPKSHKAHAKLQKKILKDEHYKKNNTISEDEIDKTTPSKHKPHRKRKKVKKNDQRKSDNESEKMQEDEMDESKPSKSKPHHKRKKAQNNEQHESDTNEAEEMAEDGIDETTPVKRKTRRKRKQVQQDEKEYICDICQKSFPLNRSLTVHKKIHTGIKPYECEMCKKTFTNSSNLIKHRRTHTDEKPYQCEYCHKFFAQCTNLTKHKRVHTGERPYQCEYCDKAFTGSSSLTVHKRIHTGDKPYPCDLCEKRFYGKDKLTRHMRFHSGERPYDCHFCGKTFPLCTYLTRHMRIHTHEKPYHCDLCPKTFSWHSSLYIHKSKHAGRLVKCQICFATFTTKSALIMHTRIHTGERPYKCELCDFTFVTRSSFIRHTRSHTGERPFQCEKCHKAFPIKNDLTRHMKIHNESWSSTLLNDSSYKSAPVNSSYANSENCPNSMYTLPEPSLPMVGEFPTFGNSPRAVSKTCSIQTYSLLEPESSKSMVRETPPIEHSSPISALYTVANNIQNYPQNSIIVRLQGNHLSARLSMPGHSLLIPQVSLPIESYNTNLNILNSTVTSNVTQTVTNVNFTGNQPHQMYLSPVVSMPFIVNSSTVENRSNQITLLHGNSINEKNRVQSCINTNSISPGCERLSLPGPSLGMIGESLPIAKLTSEHTTLNDSSKEARNCPSVNPKNDESTVVSPIQNENSNVSYNQSLEAQGTTQTSNGNHPCQNYSSFGVPIPSIVNSFTVSHGNCMEVKSVNSIKNIQDFTSIQSTENSNGLHNHFTETQNTTQASVSVASTGNHMYQSYPTLGIPMTSVVNSSTIENRNGEIPVSHGNSIEEQNRMQSCIDDNSIRSLLCRRLSLPGSTVDVVRESPPIENYNLEDPALRNSPMETRNCTSVNPIMDEPVDISPIQNENSNVVNHQSTEVQNMMQTSTGNRLYQSYLSPGVPMQSVIKSLAIKNHNGEITAYHSNSIEEQNRQQNTTECNSIRSLLCRRLSLPGSTVDVVRESPPIENYNSEDPALRNSPMETRNCTSVNPIKDEPVDTSPIQNENSNVVYNHFTEAQSMLQISTRNGSCQSYLSPEVPMTSVINSSANKNCNGKITAFHSKQNRQKSSIDGNSIRSLLCKRLSLPSPTVDVVGKSPSIEKSSSKGAALYDIEAINYTSINLIKDEPIDVSPTQNHENSDFIYKHFTEAQNISSEARNYTRMNSMKGNSPLQQPSSEPNENQSVHSQNAQNESQSCITVNLARKILREWYPPPGPSMRNRQLKTPEFNVPHHDSEKLPTSSQNSAAINLSNEQYPPEGPPAPKVVCLPSNENGEFSVPRANSNAVQDCTSSILTRSLLREWYPSPRLSVEETLLMKNHHVYSAVLHDPNKAGNISQNSESMNLTRDLLRQWYPSPALGTSDSY